MAPQASRVAGKAAALKEHCKKGLWVVSGPAWHALGAAFTSASPSANVTHRSAVKAAAGGDVLPATVQLAVALGARARVHVRQQTERQNDRCVCVYALRQEVLTESVVLAACSPSGVQRAKQ